MPALSSSALLPLVDSMATVLSQAYQLARVRLASSASPILRLMVRRDQALGEIELLRRELSILRGQRESMPPHRRPDYLPDQRWAILQLKRLRGWGILETAERLVLLAKRNIQARIDSFRLWYNGHRPHSALGGLTPDDKWRGATLPTPMPFRQSDATLYAVDVRRLRCRGDPRLPVIHITQRAA